MISASLARYAAYLPSQARSYGLLQVDLSDISAFAELPDGKVLTGSESGQLLLWDGNFIQCVIRRPGNLPCHDGDIKVVLLDREDGCFITAGDDGWLRWWDFGTIDQADLEEDEEYFYVKPLEEMRISLRDTTAAAASADGETHEDEGKMSDAEQSEEDDDGTAPAKVFGLARAPAGDFWMILDATGRLLRMDNESKQISLVRQGHAGGVSGLDASPLDHFAASVGVDGTVRCWDYITSQELFHTQCPGEGSALLWAPTAVDAHAQTVLAGFRDGVVRVMLRAKHGWKRLQVLKPHSGPVTCMAFSSDGSLLVTGSSDGTVFFFEVVDASDERVPELVVEEGQAHDSDDEEGTRRVRKGPRFVPIGFSVLPGSVNSLTWRAGAVDPADTLTAVEGGQTVLVGCGAGVTADGGRRTGQEEGRLCELTLPPASDRASTEHTFELKLPYSQYVVAMPVPPLSDKKLAKIAALEAAAAKAKAAAEADDGADRGTDAGSTTGDVEEDEEEEEEDLPAPSSGGVAVAVFKPGSDEQQALVCTELAGADTIQVVNLARDRATKAYTALQSGRNPSEVVAGTVESDGSIRQLAERHYACVDEDTTCVLRTSSSANFILSGSKAGAITIRPTACPEHFLKLHLHDCMHGNVSGVALSHDDQFILTAGMDGQIFSFRLHPAALVAAAESQAAELAAEAEKALVKPEPVQPRSTRNPREYAAKVAAAMERRGGAGGAGGVPIPVAIQRQQEVAEAMRLAAEAAEAGTDGPGSSRPDATSSKAPALVESTPETEAAATNLQRVARGRRARQQVDKLRQAQEVPSMHAEFAEALEKGGMLLSLDDMAEVAAAGGEGKVPVRSGDGVLKPVEAAAPAAKHDEVEESKLAEAEDITDQAAYSIQEAKLKMEEDNRRKAAEKKKEEVRHVIAALRSDFADLRQRMLSDPNPKRHLSERELIIDQELHEFMVQRGENAVEEVRKELEWLQRKKQIAVEKLKACFLDDVAMDAVRVKSFEGPDEISTFRTRELSPELQEALQQVHELITAEEQQLQQQSIASTGSGKGTKADANATGQSDVDAVIEGQLTLTGSEAEGLGRENSFEHRKAKRARRKAALERLRRQQPDKHVADPADEEAVVSAQVHMGDYKLKTSADYEVPEDKRVDAGKKRRQMVLLDEAVYQIRMQFNRRVLAVRDRKLATIHTIQDDSRRIQQINKELGLPVNDQVVVPKVDASEWPEWRENVNVADKNDVLPPDERERQRLYHPSKAAARANRRGSQGVTGGDFGDWSSSNAGPAAAIPAPAGMSGFVPAAVSGLEAAASAPALQEPAVAHLITRPPGVAAAGATGRAVLTRVPASVAVPSPSLPTLASILPVFQWANAVTGGEMSHDEQIAQQTHLNRLKLEKDTLLLKHRGFVQDFDRALYVLRRERVRLAADQTATALRIMLLYRELDLLRDLAKRDSALGSKLTKATQEKTAMVTAVADAAEKLSEKKEEVEEWKAKDTKIMAEFNLMVPDSHPAHAQLLKIFKRKIKRSKPRGDDDEDEASDIDSDDLDMESDFDEDEDSEEEDVCPAGCDQGLYDRVLELREKRLDQDEMLQSLNKSVEDLRKQYERYQQRERQIDKDFKNTNAEIAAFQAEKQRRLNQLRVVIAVSLSQIQCIGTGDAAPNDSNDAGTAGAAASPQDSTETPPNGPITGSGLRLPQSIDHCLIFGRTELERLRARIEGIEAEAAHEKQRFKRLNKEKRTLENGRKQLMKAIESGNSRAHELQLLKFGQVVQVDSLDRMTDGTVSGQCVRHRPVC